MLNESKMISSTILVNKKSRIVMNFVNVKDFCDGNSNVCLDSKLREDN
jgi:hypothetical protein